jgi:hypothetical protein
VREVCADVAVRGGDVVIVSGKRVEEGQDLLTQAPPGGDRVSPVADFVAGPTRVTVNVRLGSSGDDKLDPTVVVRVRQDEKAAVPVRRD